MNADSSSRRLALLVSALALAVAGCASAPLAQSTAELPEAGSPEVLVNPRVVPGNVNPTYPVELRRNRISGLVNVDCVVDERGRVLVASVERSTHGAFVKPTLEAIRQWTFEPGTRDGVPTAMRIILPVAFTMED